MTNSLFRQVNFHTLGQFSILFFPSVMNYVIGMVLNKIVSPLHLHFKISCHQISGESYRGYRRGYLYHLYYLNWPNPIHCSRLWRMQVQQQGGMRQDLHEALFLLPINPRPSNNASHRPRHHSQASPSQLRLPRVTDNHRVSCQLSAQRGKMRWKRCWLLWWRWAVARLARDHLFSV